MWLPFEISQSNFWCIYAIQCIILVYAVNHTNIADVLFFWWLREATIQLDILAYRFHMIPKRTDKQSSVGTRDAKENMLIGKYVEHHKIIYE